MGRVSTEGLAHESEARSFLGTVGVSGCVSTLEHVTCGGISGCCRRAGRRMGSASEPEPQEAEAEIQTPTARRFAKRGASESEGRAGKKPLLASLTPGSRRPACPGGRPLHFRGQVWRVGTVRPRASDSCDTECLIVDRQARGLRAQPAPQ